MALDTSGAALAAAISARPTLIKPNLEELAELTPTPLRTLGDVVKTIEDLRVTGVGQVLVSLGPLGAIVTLDSQVLSGKVSIESVRNTVGAGDALLAGFLAGGDRTAEALAQGLAWAHAALRTAGTAAVAADPSDLAAVHIFDQIDHDLVLEPGLDSAVRPGAIR